MTQVATVSTTRPTLRSAIDGWTFEDSDLLVRKPGPGHPSRIFIGHTPAPRDIPSYGTVLEMLAGADNSGETTDRGGI